MTLTRRTGRYIALALALALALGWAVGAPGDSAEARRRFRIRTSQIAEGVSFTRMVDRRGPWRIKIVTADLEAGTTLDTVLARDRLPRFETTSSMAERSGAIVAMNGDYARPSGRPVFTFSADGHLAQTPLSWGRNFGVDSSETQAFIGHPEVTAWATESDSGLTYEIQRVNEGAAGSKQIARFTPQGGGEERPPAGTCLARLFPQEAPRSLTETAGVETTNVVDRVRCGGRSM